ncbi:MAG: MBOAT family O-acyltransferase [Solirubrobacterales bacterium]
MDVDEPVVFSSLVFLYLFLPICLVLYYLRDQIAYRNTVLVIASLIFYAWGEPVWVILLIFTSLVDYFGGLLVERHRETWRGKFFLTLTLILNLGTLCFFKYTGFLLQNLNHFFYVNIPYNEYALPIGISFYTFHTVSYVVDVYRGEVAPQKSFFKLLLYVSCFHQLVAGPIIRYKDVADQIEHRVFAWSVFSSGVTRFAVGLVKKVAIANTAGEVADALLKSDLASMSVGGAWLGIIFFAIQIYFDFSGYSDMALGLGRMFGIRYKENFNFPYISQSATEFWRRWHISLGTFFRDYVYIPLGGNRKAMFRNLFIVWFLTGLWHGASWNFVTWGLFYGSLISIEKLFLLDWLRRLPAAFRHFYGIVVFLVGWVIFYYTDMHTISVVLQTMFGLAGKPLADPKFMIYLNNYAYFLVIAALCSTPLLPRIDTWVARRRLELGKVQFHPYTLLVRPAINFGFLALSTILAVGKTYNPFLYFRF